MRFFLANLLKEFARKNFFSATFSKNFNWQVIPSWVMISYKIIKFASISYKICCEKCFIARKNFFSATFSKNFNWQVIPSWVMISYKIIKIASISYKICCEKCFIQNILQGNW